MSRCGGQKLRAPQLEKEGEKTHNQINKHDASCQTITNPTKQDLSGVWQGKKTGAAFYLMVECSSVKEHCNRGLVVSVAMAAYKKALLYLLPTERSVLENCTLSVLFWRNRRRYGSSEIS